MKQDPISKKWYRNNHKENDGQSESNINTSHPIPKETRQLENPKTETSPKQQIKRIITNRENMREQNRQYDEKVFKGKYRGRVKSYYIGNIDPDSTKEGFEDYLTDRGVNPIQLSLFWSKTGDLAAKLTIPHYEDYMLEDSYFWPRFMRCRQWIPKHSWNPPRYQKTSYSDIGDGENLDIDIE
jgi:hypothetical protein